MKVNQFEEIPAIKELDDEVAATCSGGVAYTGSGDSPNINVSVGEDYYLRLFPEIIHSPSKIVETQDFVYGIPNDLISPLERKKPPYS
jgi:hypothetical protein